MCGLLPGGEAAALLDLVVVNELRMYSGEIRR